MTSFKRRVEQAIGAFRYEDDTWEDVFDRVDAEGGIDNKKITKVLISILEELDGRNQRTNTRRENREVSGGAGESEE